VAIAKVLLQLMDAGTFVWNHDGIKTGYTKDVPLSSHYRRGNAKSGPCVSGVMYAAWLTVR